MIKEAAKEKLNTSLFDVLKPLLVIFLIGVIYGIFGALFDDDSLFGYVLELLYSLAVVPLTMGFTYYVLNYVRGKKFEISQLFEFYDQRYFEILCLTILVGIFTFLWSLLLIIPGIIAAVSYSMYTYLYVDNCSSNPGVVINESKRLMDGYKLEYFVFELSFIGWILISVLTFGIAFIYVGPYITVSNALFYEELRKIKS